MFVDLRIVWFDPFGFALDDDALLLVDNIVVDNTRDL